MKKDVRKGRRLIHGLYAGLILAVSSVPGSDLPEATGLVPDKAVHFAEYCLLGLLGGWAYPTDKRKLWLLLLFGLGFAGLDEIWQSYVPQRKSEWLDFLADVAGHLVGVLTALFLLRRPG